MKTKIVEVEGIAFRVVVRKVKGYEDRTGFVIEAQQLHTYSVDDQPDENVIAEWVDWGEIAHVGNEDMGYAILESLDLDKAIRSIQAKYDKLDEKYETQIYQ